MKEGTTDWEAVEAEVQIGGLGSIWEMPPCPAFPRRPHTLSPEEADCDTSSPSHQLRW